MPKCWASCLKNCSDKISREHIVSRGLFISDSLEVQGFKWCKDEPKQIGIESVTAKILCTSHNNGLSELDSAASAAFDALRQSTRIYNIRQSSSKTKFRVIHYHIHAPKLERWFLKTLINLSIESEFLIGPEGIEPGVPPEDLVSICFGKTQFQERAGMYVAGNNGMEINSTDRFGFSPLIKDNLRILGGFFEFRGIRFFLCLMPQGLDIPLSDIPRVREQWLQADLMWRFKKIKANIRKSLSHDIEFHW